LAEGRESGNATRRHPQSQILDTKSQNQQNFLLMQMNKQTTLKKKKFFANKRTSLYGSFCADAFVADNNTARPKNRQNHKVPKELHLQYEHPAGTAK
jgi:hypothetical protein